MDTPEAVQRVKDTLNRPDADQLFRDPDDYHAALTRAQKYYYRLTASHYPELLYETLSPISSSDGGRTYTLPGDHLGEIELWAPPGPPTGEPILPCVPEANRFGFYVEGNDIVLTFKKDYNPGLYVRWVPATPTSVDGTNDPILPAYFDDALVFRATYYMASKPGFLGDPIYYKEQAMLEWEGEGSDPGILGTLSRQSAHGGYQTIGDAGAPWYKRINTGT